VESPESPAALRFTPAAEPVCEQESSRRFRTGGGVEELRKHWWTILWAWALCASLHGFVLGIVWLAVTEPSFVGACALTGAVIIVSKKRRRLT